MNNAIPIIHYIVIGTDQISTFIRPKVPILLKSCLRSRHTPLEPPLYTPLTLSYYNLTFSCVNRRTWPSPRAVLEAGPTPLTCFVAPVVAEGVDIYILSTFCNNSCATNSRLKARILFDYAVIPSGSLTLTPTWCNKIIPSVCLLNHFVAPEN